ncbi:MAG: hypothetical protein AAF430_03975 [Myxococcota bacterium]
MSDRPRNRDWSQLAESGSMGAIRLLAWIYRVFGRRFCQLLLFPIVAYFYVRERAWNGASLRYLRFVWSRPEGRERLVRPPTIATPFRHYHEFASQVFDRLVLWGGGFDQFRVDHAGSEHLFELKREGRGGILLGAHLGSFDMARSLAREYGLVLNIVMYTAHTERLNRFFEEVDPDSRLRVVSLDPTSMRTAFEIKACLDRGELVGILADRVPAGSREPVFWADFLGRPMPVPSSPFQLACLLGCPAFVSTCVRVGNGRYYASVTPLGPGRKLPRREREKGAEELARLYVRTLEAICLRYPFQWFNFFDPPEKPDAA